MSLTPPTQESGTLGEEVAGTSGRAAWLAASLTVILTVLAMFRPGSDEARSIPNPLGTRLCVAAACAGGPWEPDEPRG